MVAAAYGLAFVAAAPCLYLLGLALAAAAQRVFGRNPAPAGALGQGQLVFVVPAHNEEADIESTILGLASLCDAECSIHVVADNCSDRTADIVRARAASCSCPLVLWERQDPTKKAKGYALEWVLPQVFAWGDQRGKPVAFVCIVDADASLTPGSVAIARQRFSEGRSVLQSQYLFGRGLGLRAEIMRIGSAAFVARGLGRSALGLSDTLKGNGMWFRRAVLEETPWCAYSLAEDLEYTVQILRKGHRVYVLPGSIVTGRLSATSRGESEQRLRWEGGRWAVVRGETGALLRDLARKPSFQTLDMLLELLIPPLGLLVPLQIAVLGVTLLLPGDAWLGVALGWVLLGLYVLLSFALARLPARTLLALAYVPFFLVWKLLLLPRTIAASRSKRWVRTAR